VERNDITADRDRADKSETADATEPMDISEAREPTDPIERAEPTDPIDRIDPFEAILRSESSDHRDQSDVRFSFVMRPVLSSSRATDELNRLAAI
jgi:hypothetical protein